MKQWSSIKERKIYIMVENIMNPNEEKEFTLSEVIQIAETKAAYDAAYAIYLEREYFGEAVGEQALKLINEHGDMLEKLLGKERASELLESVSVWDIDEDGLPIYLPKPISK